MHTHVKGRLAPEHCQYLDATQFGSGHTCKESTCSRSIAGTSMQPFLSRSAVYICGFKAPLRGRHRSLRTARPGLRSAAPARPRACGEGGGVGNSTCRHRYPMYNLAIVRHSDGVCTASARTCYVVR